MSDRNWDRAIALKLGVGIALATVVAPVLAIIADRARVYRNTIRHGRRSA